MKVLVAYDGSPASEAAIEEVLRRPWPSGTRVRLLTVIEPGCVAPAPRPAAPAAPAART